MQPETRFKLAIMKKLKELPNSWWLKTNEKSVRGIPDIIGCINGYFYAFELKVGRNSASSLQKKVVDDICKANGKACVVRPEDLVDLIRHLRSVATITYQAYDNLEPESLDIEEYKLSPSDYRQLKL